MDWQSKSKELQEQLTQTEETQNPETAFSKVYSLPISTPLHECKCLLEAMKEESLFEKQTIARLHRVAVPRSIVKERMKSEAHSNYESVVQYTRKKQERMKFQQKGYGLKLKIRNQQRHTVKEIIEDCKTRLLTEENKHQAEDLRVKIMLNDRKACEQVFNESILLERLYYLQGQSRQVRDEVKSLSSKFKGLNPKHFRLPEKVKNEEEFQRRKYVHHQRTYQYFKHALQIERGLLRTKQEGNALVIKQLMAHNEGKTAQENDADQLKDVYKIEKQGHKIRIKKIQDFNVQFNVHRLFLKYACNSSEEIQKMYTIVPKKSLLEFFADFEINWQVKPQIIKIVDSNQDFTQFLFLEILHLLSIQKDDAFYSDISGYLQTNILHRRQKCLPNEWLTFYEHKDLIFRICKLKHYRRHLTRAHKQIVLDKRKEFTTSLTSFDELIDILWSLKIYPSLVSKNRIRFYFLYEQNSECGVTLKSLGDIIILIALHREGDVQDNAKAIVDKVVCFK